MRFSRTALAVAFVAGLIALPLSGARAQYYPWCNPFPLTWPFCVAGAAVGAAATIATAPFRVVAGPPYYYYGYPYYYRGYYSRHYWWCRRHPYRCR
jgi:hypothetical protein